MATGTRTRRAASTPELDASALSNVERLIFAQAVHEFGSNAWQEIAKMLSKHPLVAQPKGVFTPQSCTALYERLMEEAGLEWSETDTAPRLQRHLRLAQRFYVARVTELRELIAAEEAKFKKLATEIDEIRSGAWDHKILVTMGVEADVEAPTEVVSESLEVEEPEPPKPENGLKEEEEEEERAPVVPPPIEPPPVEPPPETPKEDEQAVDDVIELSDSPSPSEHDAEEKEEGSDNEAVDELIGNFGSDKVPPETQERDDAPSPAPKQPSPEADVADEMQVDQETVKADDEVSERSADTSKGDAPPASREQSEEAQEMDELEPDIEPGPSKRAEGKRKAEDEDSVMLDAQREKKRPREESEPVDDDEGAFKTRRSQRSGTGGGEMHVVSKRFQNMIGMLHSQISQHRYGNIFHNPIKKSEAPDYGDIVKRPMDLKTIKSRVKDGLVSNSLEFQRDIFLMFANAMMYNRPGSEIYNMAEEMLMSSERDINAFRQTEGFHRM